MITKEQALQLRHGQVLYHVFGHNSDGSPERWRVNGMVKTWKTRPAEFEVPVKHGLYAYGYLNQRNAEELCLTEAEAYACRATRKLLQ